jgi:hypothetical protein
MTRSLILTEALTLIIIILPSTLPIGIEILILLRIVLIIGLNLLALHVVVAHLHKWHLPLLEVVGDDVVLAALNAHELASVPALQDDLHVEQLVVAAQAQTVEFDFLDVGYPEVDDWLGDEDH